MIDIGHDFLATVMFMVPFKLLAFALWFGIFVITAQGQVPVVATCNAGFEWSFNSLNQSPCQLASYLGGTCIGGPFGIPPLPNTGNVYEGLPLGENNICRCSSVFYSALSACSNFTCRMMVLTRGSFPRDVPSETRIPSWAYLDVRQSNNTFNPQIAQRESEAELTSSNPKSSRIGPIIGGTVGAVALLVTAGILVFRLNKVRRANKNKQEILISHVEPFTTTLDTDSKSRRNTKQMQVETPAQSPISSSSSSHTPIADSMQVRQLMDDISVVPSTSLAQPSVVPSRAELYDRIDVLARENAVLREQAFPPEYEGSTVGLGRSNSRSATLPSYSHGDGRSYYDHDTA
ncbi:hypothetical protein VNI00_016302 [Paramarasmius palmivorus]|uniref:Uncharacterized protein n=1 Tax=Paramarasmius palmivorus TaxID=297713 RepID=A0AAW0BCY1_9AGAR